MIEFLKQISEPILFFLIDVPKIIISASMGAIGEITDALRIIKTAILLFGTISGTIGFFLRGKKWK